MGFLGVAFNLPKVIVISLLIDLLTHLKLIFTNAFTKLGLLKPQEEEYNSWESSDNYVLIFDGSSPSLVPIPVYIVTASIKKKLPIVKYGDFVGSDEEEEEEEEEEEGKLFCSVCLEKMEREEEMRVLCNCDHVFHRECLDTWIDVGQITCPLCRSNLLPPKVNINQLRRDCGGGGGGGGGDLSAVTGVIGEDPIR